MISSDVPEEMYQVLVCLVQDVEHKCLKYLEVQNVRKLERGNSFAY